MSRDKGKDTHNPLGTRIAFLALLQRIGHAGVGRLLLVRSGRQLIIRRHVRLKAPQEEEKKIEGRKRLFQGRKSLSRRESGGMV